MRTLLDTIEQTLKEYDFPDLYVLQKRHENSIAMSEFEDRIRYLDTLKDPALELIVGELVSLSFKPYVTLKP